MRKRPATIVISFLRSSFGRRPVALGLALLGLMFLPATRAAEIGQDGGITLTVSFEKPDLDCGPLQAPIDEAGAEQHYCQVMEEFSQELYYTTEGNHWIKRVRFMENLEHRDIQWHYLTRVCDSASANAGAPCNKRCNGGSNDKGGCENNGYCPGGFCEDSDCPGGSCQQCSASSYASFNGGYVMIREKGFRPDTAPSPYQPARKSTIKLARLMNHEFGHFFYALPDEYVNFKNFRGGATGFCADTYVDNSPGAKSTGTICDEESDCAGSQCIFKGRCMEPPGELGETCASDAECDPNSGLCLGANANRDDQASNSTKRICSADTPLMNDIDGVCLMRTTSRRQWCDGGLDGDEQVQGASHVYTDPDNGSYGNTVNFDLGNAAGPPSADAEDALPNGFGKRDYIGHSCWHEAGVHHPDLQDVHVVGQYVEPANIGAPPQPLDCQWKIDLLGDSPNPALLVDKSGSMAYDDFSNPPDPAVDVALAGALYFYNEVPDGNYAGVYVYDSGVVPATTNGGGTSLAFGQKQADLDEIDDETAAGSTNIQKAIELARGDINGQQGVPESTRDIVIFSDGKHNDPNDDPFAEAQLACDEGMFVHTIAYGDADSAALEQLAKCGTFWVAGTEDANDIAFEEPDPLEIKTALARMVHKIKRETELLEERGALDPLTASTVETRTFVVPEGSDTLVFSWLANHTCVRPDPSSPECEPVMNLLTTVEIESPSLVAHPATLTTDGANGVYRRVEVASPEPGTWTARIDKTEPNPAPSTIPGEWETKVPDTRVGWVAHVDHPGIEAEAWTSPGRGPLTMPVTILARLRWGYPLTNIAVSATVTHRGQSWSVPLMDDGAHGDDAPGDGLYGGTFNPDGTWADVTDGAYRVKVRMISVAGSSLRIDEGEPDEDPADPEPAVLLIDQRGDAVVEAETSFRLSTRYSLDPDGNPVVGSVNVTCPDLLQGGTFAGLVANVNGVALDPENTLIAMGKGIDESIDSLVCGTCSDTATDPVGTISFSATVDPAAPTGPRDVQVKVGRDILLAEDACRVCAPLANEACNGIDDDCDGLVDEDAAGAQDSDTDGVLQVCDNCPFVANRRQSDFDADGQGDRCDVDDGRIHSVFTSNTRLEWDAEGGNTQWNAYRGDAAVLQSSGIYTQAPGSNLNADRACGLTGTLWDDSHVPAPGTASFYLVTSVFAGGESSLGQDSAGNGRLNQNPCPTGPPT